jgi:hypothetical protein
MFARFAWIWALVTALIAAGVGAIAYHAGVTAQLIERGGTAVAPAPYYGYGFGFGWIIPLLFFLLLLSFFARKRRHWYGGGGGHSPWEHRLEDWHKQQHGENPPQQPTPTAL